MTVALIDILGLILTLAGLALAVYALYLSLRTAKQLSDVETLTTQAQTLLNGVKEDLAAFDARQSAQLDELSEAVTAIQTSTDALQAGSEFSFQALDQMEDGAAAEDLAAEYERMRAVPPGDLPDDVAKAVTDESGSEIVWGLRRRGGGRPRWLIGTQQRGPWRVTRRDKYPAVTEVPFFQDEVEPINLGDLEPEARTALASATGIDPGEIDETVFRRQGRRGVPVYYVVIAPASGGARVWRLVKTRWGWSAVAEDG